MKRIRLIITILITLLLPNLMVFSVEIVNMTEAVLLFMPRRVSYDQAAAIELSTAKTETVNSFKTGNTPNLDFVSDSPDLALFRLYDTLDNMVSEVPIYNPPRYNVSNSALNHHENDPVVTIHTTGIFVKVGDSSITRDFSLKAFYTKAKIKSDGSAYDSSTATVTELGENTNPYFKRIGSVYTLYIPDTPPVRIGNDTTKYYPYYLSLFDICISLDNNASNLEEGLYQTEITVTSTSYRNNKLTEYVQGDNKPIKQITSEPMTLSQTFTVYGYFSSTGENPGASNEQFYSFVVSPSSDTYSMDLSPSDVDETTGYKSYTPYFAVANLNFNAIKVEANETTPNPETAYEIYISPTNQYTNGSTDFRFVKVGNTGKTISYDLFVGTGSSFTSFASGFTSSAYSSSSIAGNGGTNANGYYVLPKYTCVTSTHNGARKYTETWQISDLIIYLKVKDEDGTIVNSSENGEYQSYLYFTVVVK